MKSSPEGEWSPPHMYIYIYPAVLPLSIVCPLCYRSVACPVLTPRWGRVSGRVVKTEWLVTRRALQGKIFSSKFTPEKLMQSYEKLYSQTLGLNSDSVIEK